jgi:predicted metal-dependent hydrolase
VEWVEKERAILERLERIDDLRDENAPAGVLLEEVRALLSEAEDWVREEPAAPDAAVGALERSRAALAAGERRTEKMLLGR